MYLVINKCVTAVKVSNFSGHYLRNRSTLDIGVLVYIGRVQHKEHSPEVLSILPGTPCIQGGPKVGIQYIHFLCSILKFPAIIYNTCKEKNDYFTPTFGPPYIFHLSVHCNLSEEIQQ